MILGNDSTFNNVRFSDYNLYVCDFDDNILKEVGIKFNRNITRNNNIRYNPTYSIENTDDYTVDINLILYNSSKHQKLEWTDEILQKVYSWLITDDFKEFTTEGSNLSYYLIVTSIQKVFTLDRKGYLKVTFKSMDGYAYRKETYSMVVKGSDTMSVMNLSNGEYKPKIVIKNNGNSETVNKINQLEVSGVDGGSTLTVDNLMCTAESNGENAFDKVTNRGWVSLDAGNNNLSLSGDMTVEVICEFPVIL